MSDETKDSDPIAQAVRIVHDIPDVVLEIDWRKEPATESERLVRQALVREILVSALDFGGPSMMKLELSRKMRENNPRIWDPKKTASDFREAWDIVEKWCRDATENAKRVELAKAVARVRAEAAAPAAAVKKAPVHECVPTIVQPNVKERAEQALEALEDIICFEAGNLRMLRRLERTMRRLKNDEAPMDKTVPRQLSAAYKVLSDLYMTGATSDLMDLRSRIGEKVPNEVGFLSGDLIGLSNGDYAVARYGYLADYQRGDRNPQEAIREDTCDECRPNFEAMLAADRAAGLIPEADA